MTTHAGWKTQAAICFSFGTIGLAGLPIGATIGWAVLAATAGLCLGRSAGATRCVRRLTGWTGTPGGLGAAAAVGILAVCLVASGLVLIFGGAAATAVGFGVGILLTSRHLLARQRAHRPDPATRTTAAPPAEPSVGELPTDELCLAWRRSYLALHRATDEEARYRLIQRRQKYLDEIERRDRAGFERWLSSGARASGDPRRYLAVDG
ncbi:hypothetical protein Q5425_43960 [Amycolatopsis sp. A133]|uniref:hypothetical protein n=1 Tax=Amycolatopsis sp. A133 TaxID=3064472 RepID=UPI0027EB5733|nr:hypothetical protein [Amycolatopsis sp. A133]MDQ7810723.1 hypothetical protein [Amycolatopsis sp. A133]